MRNSLKNMTKNYATIPNELIRDLELSAHARTLYAYIASMSEEWEFTNRTLMKAIGVKEDKLRKVIKELENKGWLERVQMFTKGRKSGYEYIIYADLARHREKHDTVKKRNPLKAEPVKTLPLIEENHFIEEKKKIEEKEEPLLSITEPIDFQVEFDKEKDAWIKIGFDVARARVEAFEHIKTLGYSGDKQ